MKELAKAINRLAAAFEKYCELSKRGTQIAEDALKLQAHAMRKLEE